MFKSFKSEIQQVKHCWSSSAFRILFHGHFNKLGENILESRITLKDMKVMETGGV